MDFNKLPKDVISIIALDLDLPDLLNYCKTYDRVNEATCSQNIFWINKIKNDFNIEYSSADARKRYEEILFKPIFIRESLRQFLWHTSYGPNDSEIKNIIRSFLEQGYINREIISALFTKYSKLNSYFGDDDMKYITADPVARTNLLPYFQQTRLDPNKFKISDFQKLIQPGILNSATLPPKYHEFIEDKSIIDSLKNAASKIRKL